MRKPCFVSTSVYALGRQLGMEAADAEVRRQLTTPGKDSLPCVRTVYRIQQLTDVALWLDCGATIIAKTRSRAFHAAYESGCEAWVSVDDDVEATTITCSTLLDVLDDLLPRVVIVPCMLRDAESVRPRLNVHIPHVRIERQSAGAKLITVRTSGFGMVGMNRKAMDQIVELADYLKYTDHDGVARRALFHEIIDGHIWYGEDTSFFKRVPSTVSIEALLCGQTVHAGLPLELGTL